jgi:hypothetical protein
MRPIPQLKTANSSRSQSGIQSGIQATKHASFLMKQEKAIDCESVAQGKKAFFYMHTEVPPKRKEDHSESEKLSEKLSQIRPKLYHRRGLQRPNIQVKSKIQNPKL